MIQGNAEADLLTGRFPVRNHLADARQAREKHQAARLLAFDLDAQSSNFAQ
jgi:hypothetical protein